MSETPDVDAIRDKLRDCRLFVVPYCHADWAWTHSRRWHRARYVLAIGEALDILDAQDADGVPPDAPHAFRWYLDCWRTELQPFLEAHPERLAELQRRVSEGRIAICGGYSNVRINHVPGETFVRGMPRGRREFRRLFPDADLSVHADIVDVAVGHPQMPQLLRLAGYDYLRFWRPHDALNEKSVPHQFVWEGLDGSQVIAQRGSYGGLHTPDVTPADFRERWNEVVATWWGRELEEKRNRTPVDFIMMHNGCDDARPLRAHPGSDLPMDLPGLIQEWNAREDSSLAFATLPELFAELAARREDLATIAGTLDPCDVGFNAAWGGSRGLWRLRLDCAREICHAETLDALTIAAGIADLDSAQAQQATEDLWRDALLCSAHATQWLFQDDFDELHELATNTVFRAERRQTDSLTHLARAVDCPENALALTHNPLAFERTVTVPLRVTFMRGDTGGVPDPLRLVDADGEELTYQITRELRHGGVRWELETLAQVTLPAGGWNTICWTPEEPTEAPGEPNDDAISNRLLTLRFDRGRLTRIEDAASGEELTAPVDAPFGHLRTYNVDATAPLHVGPILGTADARWTSWRVTERGPVRWSFRSEGEVGGCPASLEARLYRGERRVEMRVEVDWDGRDGFLVSHIPVSDEARLFADMPFCVEDKRLDEEPYVGIERRREGMFIARSFVDAGPLAYVSHDGDRYFIRDREAGTLAHILVNSVRSFYAEWEENVNRQMRGEGRHEFTFSLVPHAGDWREAGLWRLSEDLRNPAQTAWPLPGGELPAKRSLISVEPANVQMSACYLDGGRLLLLHS